MRASFWLSILALLWTVSCWAQPTVLPPAKEILASCDRVVQLMDATRVSVPELARAGEPVIENAKQALTNLQAGGVQNSPHVYTFLLNLRAYLALTDAVPKPASLAEEGRKQFHELRDAQDRLDAYFRALIARKEEQLREPDRDALARYAESNQKLGPLQASRPRVVFLGDSITDFWRLNEYFSTDRDFVNRGISGQITGQMLGRMLGDVVDLKPSAVLVLAGTNDIARGVPLKAIQDNLTMIAELAEAHKITPMFASLLPVNSEQSVRRPPTTIRVLNDWLQKFCRDRSYVYIDYYSKMADIQGLMPADLADDGLHPNSKGYRVMAPIALAAVDKVLRPPAQKKR
jgi:acyl-CoA thioesterase I